jgi:hypothetical protein
MSLRPALVHSCFDQNRVFQFMEPFFSANLTKADLRELWEQASAHLGEIRPKNCRCSYRVTVEEADLLVKNGIADYLITDWRYNEEKKTFFPAPNLNLVWGGKQAEDLGLIKASYAAKTPRVMTLERANLERAYVDGRQDEIDRIEIWGELAREVIADLTTEYWPELDDPFKGRAVLPLIGFDQRSQPGKSVDKDSGIW